MPPASPLKCWPTSMRLHGSVLQKAVVSIEFHGHMVVQKVLSLNLSPESHDRLIPPDNRELRVLQ